MTQELLNYKESDLLFLDIETVREFDSISTDHPKFRTFQNKMRDRENDTLPSIEETLELYKRKAGLYPIYSKIVCITMGFIFNDKIYLKSFSGEESDILQNTVNTIKENKGKTLIWWNQSFDLPAIRQRFIINGLKNYLPDSQGNDSMKKPWTLKGTLDLMDVWKGINFNNSSMDEVAIALNLPSSKIGEVEGSKLSDFYYKEGITEIVKYCERDVTTLINIYRKLTYKEAIEEIIVKTSEKTKPKKLNVLQKIASDIVPSEEEMAILDARIENMEGEEKEIALEIKNAASFRDKPFFD